MARPPTRRPSATGRADTSSSPARRGPAVAGTRAAGGRSAGARAAGARAGASTDSDERIAVRKTYKIYIGGAFPRSESGRSFVVRSADGAPLANAVRGSRKDVRDAVRAARSAFPGWDGRTAMNRGQVLYRVAELMEGRRDQFVAEVAAAEGLGPAEAAEQVERAIDRWVWYAGWADKISQLLGTVNPVAASYFDFTIPEATGVVGIVAPDGSSLLGLVSRLAPVVVSGNTAVVLASEPRPLPAVTLTEVLATSDVPGGVINLITGHKRELVPWLAAHMDVNAIDLFGVPQELRAATEEAAVDSMKRLARAPRDAERFDWLDDARAQRLEWIARFMEMKTVWHPIGM